MFKRQELLKAKLSEVSAKSLSLGGKQFLRRRNEQKIKFEEEFTYDALSGPRCIRLLKIHEGDDTDVVRCDVFEADLGRKPYYEALSYAWSLDPELSFRTFEVSEDVKKEERPIVCNGKTHLITMNLYHALTEFRRRGWTKTPFWADQICINQDDTDEKIAHLTVMVDIYSSAACVTIWLGKLTMAMSSGLDFMERLPDEPPTSHRASEADPKKNKFIQAMSDVSSTAHSLGQSAHWITVFLIIGRSWFSRSWVLQELFVAADFKFILGSREVSPTSITKAASQVFEFFATDPLSLRVGANVSMLAIRKGLKARETLFKERERFQSGKRFTAEEYLTTIRNRRATIPKDKVFAGAALLEQDVPSATTYRSTTLEVYLDYAASRLYPETGLLAMSLVGGTAANVEGLPSWVPDLSMALRPEPLRNCGCPIFKSAVLPGEEGWRIEDKTLHVRGAKWGVVKDVGESVWSWTQYDDSPYNRDESTWGKVNRMRTSSAATNERFGLMFALLNKLGTTYTPTGERTIDAFWQSMIGGVNRLSEDKEAIWRDRFQQWFAFTLVSIRANLREEKKDASRLIMPSSKKWMVPLVADLEQLERRVAHFLDVHDQHLDEESASQPTTLRTTISYLGKRLGIPELEEESGWTNLTEDILTSIRREKFFTPISIFAMHFETVYSGRRIFTSEKGYLGTGTEAVQAGDLIYLLAGASVPYILRPAAGMNGTYTLVGEAYVHGIMDGGDHLLEGLEVESISIV